MMISKEDQVILGKAYNSYLDHIINYLHENSIFSLLQIYAVFIHFLKSGQLNLNQNITFDENYNYLYLGDNLSNGIIVISGICCCRHVNTLFYDILNKLKYPVQFAYCYVDEYDYVAIVDPCLANHLWIELQDKRGNFLLDPYNDFFTQIDNDGNFILIDKPTNLQLGKPICDYLDKDIHTISVILKKYDQLRNLGINHVYSYKY